MSGVVDYIRTTDAPDAGTAQQVVSILARSEGHTVKTVKSVRLVKPGDPITGLARYTVTLAVAA